MSTMRSTVSLVWRSTPITSGGCGRGRSGERRRRYTSDARHTSGISRLSTRKAVWFASRGVLWRSSPIVRLPSADTYDGTRATHAAANAADAPLGATNYAFDARGNPESPTCRAPLSVGGICHGGRPLSGGASFDTSHEAVPPKRHLHFLLACRNGRRDDRGPWPGGIRVGSFSSPGRLLSHRSSRGPQSRRSN